MNTEKITHFLKNQTKNLLLITLLTTSAKLSACDNLWRFEKSCFRYHAPSIRSITFASNLLMASSNYIGGISLHNFDSKESDVLIEGTGNEKWRKCNKLLTFQNNQTLLSYHTESGQIALYDTYGNGLEKLESDSYSTILLDAHDKNMLFVAGGSGFTNKIKTLSINNKEMVGEYEVSTEGISALAQNVATNILGIAAENEILFLDGRTFQQAKRYPCDSYLNDIFFMPHAEMVLAVGYYYLELIDQKTWESLKKIELPEQNIVKIALDPLERYIALVINDLTFNYLDYTSKSILQVRDAKTLDILSEHFFKNIANYTPTLAFSPDGEKIVLGTDNGKIKPFDVQALLK